MRKGDTTLTLHFASAADKKAFLTYQKWWARELKKREEAYLSNDSLRGPRAFAYADVVGDVIVDQTLPVTERCRFCGCEWLCPDCDGGAVRRLESRLPPVEFQNSPIRFAFDGLFSKDVQRADGEDE